MKHITMILLLVALLAAAIPTPAHASAPDNYCTSVNVTATATGYDVSAIGNGRYARIRDLTAAQTVVATAFGSGATAYTWTRSGCLFTPPPPLGVVFGDLVATVEGQIVTLTWDTLTEIGNVGFNVYRDSDPAGNADNETWTYLAFVPSPLPGSGGGAEYQYTDTPGAGTWYYWVESVDQVGWFTLHGPVTATVESATAVTLASFDAAGAGCVMRQTTCTCFFRGKPYRAPVAACKVWR